VGFVARSPGKTKTASISFFLNAFRMPPRHLWVVSDQSTSSRSSVRPLSANIGWYFANTSAASSTCGILQSYAMMTRPIGYWSTVSSAISIGWVSFA
jgi:hypothetical protein